MSRAANNHANDKEACAQDGDIAATEKIRERTDERADRSLCEKIAKDEPDPSVGSPNVLVNVRRPWVR